MYGFIFLHGIQSTGSVVFVGNNADIIVIQSEADGLSWWLIKMAEIQYLL